LLLRPLLIVNGLRCPTVLRVAFPARALFFSSEESAFPALLRDEAIWKSTVRGVGRHPYV